MSSVDTSAVLASLQAQESAGGVKSKANYVQAHTRDLEDAEAHRQTAGAISNLQDQVYAQNRAIRQLAGATSSIIIPTPSNVDAPGNATINSVVGSIDTLTGYVTLSVAITPPAPLGTFIGCHLFVEIPDQSANPALVVGTSTVGGTAAVTGQWSPLDIGRQVYVASQQPWIVSFPIPAGIDPALVTSCRLDVVSYSTVVENQLIQGVTPSYVFTLTAATAPAPASGTTVTTNMGLIVATALTPVNVTGVLKTPVEVIVASAPLGISGWVGQLILTYGSADPTLAANQFPVGPIFSTAGPVNSGNDGISVAHSFAVDTPNTVKNATVWGIVGLVDSAGNYQWNKIVPGITPSWPITLGTTTGTIDAASVLLSSITSTMSVVANQFGVANNGIATINIQALAITNPLLAALAVDAAKLATGAVTATKIGALAVGTAAIQLLAVDNTIIANASVDAAKIVTATITSTQIASATIVGANIASATILDANIATCNVTKLTSGTITAGLITVGITGSGVVTSLTQAFDSSAGINYGIQLKDASGNTRTSIGSKATYIFDASNNLMVQSGIISGAGFIGAFGTSNQQIYLDATVPQIYTANGSGSRVSLDLDGSNNGRIRINNTQVLSTRVTSTPVTLADVIAVLQHHGLSN